MVLSVMSYSGSLRSYFHLYFILDRCFLLLPCTTFMHPILCLNTGLRNDRKWSSCMLSYMDQKEQQKSREMKQNQKKQAFAFFYNTWWWDSKREEGIRGKKQKREKEMSLNRKKVECRRAGEYETWGYWQQKTDAGSCPWPGGWWPDWASQFSHTFWQVWLRQVL